MAHCIHCNAEAQLYASGVPVCVRCSKAQEAIRNVRSEHQALSILHQDLQEATERARAATVAFDALASKISSGLPHPDGTQQIHNASREVFQARVELMRAHSRLNDFVVRGIVPEDLKRSG